MCIKWNNDDCSSFGLCCGLQLRINFALNALKHHNTFLFLWHLCKCSEHHFSCWLWFLFLINRWPKQLRIFLPPLFWILPPPQSQNPAGVTASRGRSSFTVYNLNLHHFISSFPSILIFFIKLCPLVSSSILLLVLITHFPSSPRHLRLSPLYQTTYLINPDQPLSVSMSPPFAHFCDVPFLRPKLFLCLLTRLWLILMSPELFPPIIQVWKCWGGFISTCWGRGNGWCADRWHVNSLVGREHLQMAEDWCQLFFLSWEIILHPYKMVENVSSWNCGQQGPFTRVILRVCPVTHRIE